jgi:ubiquinone/menaquinone biosynthesis C-methylase UbiE
MLAVARAKGLTNTVVADALQLPFADASFDVVTVAFGLRNMADWARLWRRWRGFLRPAVTFWCLIFPCRLVVGVRFIALTYITVCPGCRSHHRAKKRPTIISVIRSRNSRAVNRCVR